MPQNTSSSSIFGRLSTSTRSSFMSAKDVRCTVHLLHDSDIIANEFPKNNSAQTILDYICELKKIEERDFLGLRYQDHNKHRYWLNLSRSIGHVVKQFRTESLSLHLRFRYYPSDPTRIRDPNLRYQLFVQLQRDLLHGRLYCPHTQSAELAALILQVQLGDYNEAEHPANYVSGYKLLLRQTPKLEEKIESLHKNMKGKSADEAELEFLEKASQLDTYAFDPYTIKDPIDPNNAVYLGASAKGILIYTGTSKAHHIDWTELSKVDYSGKELRIVVKETYQPPIRASHTSPTGTLEGHNSNSNGHVGNSTNFSATEERMSPKKGTQTLKYVCPSGQFAKYLWNHILSQQAFFNEATAQDVKLKFSKPRIPLLSRGSTFRFPSRRVYREIEEGFSSGNESTIARSMIENNGNLANGHTDDESPFNVSTISVPVFRYELPRQEMRIEQPWLNKSNKVSSKTSGNITDTYYSSSDRENNNVKGKPTNLNFSLTDTMNEMKNEQTPSTSDEIPQPTYINTVKAGEQNSASFTVHLVKREESRSQSPVGFGEKNEEDVGLLGNGINKINEIFENDESPGQPIASSTPRVGKAHFEQNGNIGNGVHNGKNTIPNELSVHETTVAKKSGLTKVTNAMFVLFLLLLLTMAVIICVFERADGTNSDWIENQKILCELRHVYYEPARHYIVDQYRKRFGGK